MSGITWKHTLVSSDSSLILRWVSRPNIYDVSSSDKFKLSLSQLGDPGGLILSKCQVEQFCRRIHSGDELE